MAPRLVRLILRDEVSGFIQVFQHGVIKEKRTLGGPFILGEVRCDEQMNLQETRVSHNNHFQVIAGREMVMRVRPIGAWISLYRAVHKVKARIYSRAPWRISPSREESSPSADTSLPVLVVERSRIQTCRNGLRMRILIQTADLPVATIV
jgi:hypothetical protein